MTALEPCHLTPARRLRPVVTMAPCSSALISAIESQMDYHRFPPAVVETEGQAGAVFEIDEIELLPFSSITDDDLPGRENPTLSPFVDVPHMPARSTMTPSSTAWSSTSSDGSRISRR